VAYSCGRLRVTAVTGLSKKAIVFCYYSLDRKMVYVRRKYIRNIEVLYVTSVQQRSAWIRNKINIMKHAKRNAAEPDEATQRRIARRAGEGLVDEAIATLQPVIRRNFTNPYAVKHILLEKNSQDEEDLMHMMMSVFQLALPMARRTGSLYQETTNWGRLHSMVGDVDKDDITWPIAELQGGGVIETCMQQLRYRLEDYFRAPSCVFREKQPPATEVETYHLRRILHVISRGLVASRPYMTMEVMLGHQFVWYDLHDGMHDLMKTFDTWEEVKEEQVYPAPDEMSHC
jgi:hypothetical protein